MADGPTAPDDEVDARISAKITELRARGLNDAQIEAQAERIYSDAAGRGAPGPWAGDPGLMADPMTRAVREARPQMEAAANGPPRPPRPKPQQTEGALANLGRLGMGIGDLLMFGETLPGHEITNPLGKFKAGALGALDMASYGHADEAGGAIAAMGPSGRMLDAPGAANAAGGAYAPAFNRSNEERGQIYRGGRNAIRDTMDESQAEEPGMTLLGQAAGLFLGPKLPIPGLGKVAGKLTGKAAGVAEKEALGVAETQLAPAAEKALGVADTIPLNRGAATVQKVIKAAPTAGKLAVQQGVEGAAYGSGSSRAELTGDNPDVRGYLMDVGESGVASAGIGVGGKLMSESGQALGGYLKDTLARRIMSEIAQGTATTTPTGRKKLEMARDAIVEEIAHGPNADAIRKGLHAGAEEGRTAVEPVLDSLRAQRAADYQAFHAAGQGVIDGGTYVAALKAAEQKALEDGNDFLRLGLQQMQAQVADFAKAAGGQIKLEQLRKLTTDTQRAAAGALGGLHEQSLYVRVKNELSDVATEAMDDILEHQANTPQLKQVAGNIRANNQRFNALLTIDDNLKLRTYKEATREGVFERVGKHIAVPAAAGGVAAMVGDGDAGDRASRGLTTAAALSGLKLAAPRLGRAMDRGVTSRAINSARGTGALHLLGQFAGMIPPEQAARAARPLMLPLLRDPLDAILGR